MKKILTLIICFFFPRFLKPFFLNILGHKIHPNVKISMCLIYSKQLNLADCVKIGYLNIVYNTAITMEKGSYFGRRNVVNGPFEIILREKAAIGKNNKISRGKKGITYNNAKLELGILTKITANHYIDVTRSIVFGNYSILAGVFSQLWTHGYVHAPSGSARFRVDGEINIGNNVYIGSGVIINPGVSIADAINIGGNSTVSKSLTKSGMYVSQPLRYLEKNYESIMEGMVEVREPGLIEKVFEKSV